ncbi:MAG: anthranilate synthase component II [Fibrobacterota bacterium]
MVLLLDNYDSFTYNLAHSITEIIGPDFDILRNDALTVEDAAKYDTLIFSPGPGIPDEAGILKPLINRYYKEKNMLGVCLGCQAVSEVLNGRIINLDTVYHGVATDISVCEDDYLFQGISTPFSAGRYHSWVIDRESLPSCLHVTCEDEQKQVMGIAHEHYNVRGVQFHPESILTPKGDKMIRNFLEYSKEL